MGAKSGHMSLRKAGLPYRIKVSSCENWEVYTWKDVNLGEIFNGDVNLAAELFVVGPGRDLFGALIAAGAYSSEWASIDCLEEHVERQHGPEADRRWQGVSRLLHKLSRGAKDHGYGYSSRTPKVGVGGLLLSGMRMSMPASRAACVLRLSRPWQALPAIPRLATRYCPHFLVPIPSLES